MPPRPNYRCVHYSDLSPSKPGEVFWEEYNTYLDNLPRWLAQGLEGKWAVLTGPKVHGIFDTQEDAQQAGCQDFEPGSFCVKRIEEWEPVFFTPWSRTA